MRFDLTTSMVEIAGVKFPVVGLVCPQHETREPQTPSNRLLGSLVVQDSGEPALSTLSTRFSGGMFDVYVPFENATIMHLGLRRDRVDLTLLGVDCAEDKFTIGELYWIPKFIEICSDGLIRYRSHYRGAWEWSSVDEEWLVEHLCRVSRAQYVDLDPAAPAVEMIPLAKFANVVYS